MKGMTMNDRLWNELMMVIVALAWMFFFVSFAWW